MNTIYDEVSVSQQYYNNEKYQTEDRIKYAHPTIEQIKSLSFAMFCNSLAMHTFVLQAMSSAQQKINNQVEESIDGYVQYLSHCPAKFQEPTRLYDPLSIEDMFFSVPLCLYISLFSKDKVKLVCELTSYGRYRGSDKVNSPVAIYCRMMRAFYLNDETWLQEELNTLKNCRREPDPSHISFALPPKKMYDLFSSVFYGNEDQFRRAVIECSKWYKKKADRTDRTEQGYKYYVSINALLLSAIKIAGTYKSMTIEISDPFLPFNLITWE